MGQIEQAYRLKGTKFYYFEENKETPQVVRLIQYDDLKRRYKVTDGSDNRDFYIDQETLENNWVKLNPDGILEFLICYAIDNQGDEVPDCMVTLRRKTPNGGYEPIPYLVCRQAALDIFILLQQEKYVAGMCITQDTCPPELKFDGCYKYSKFTRQELVATYMDDTLDSILRVLNTKKYDERLRLIKSRDQMGIPGYHDNLRDFMRDNFFMLDFHKAFGIHEFEFKDFDFEDYRTNKVLTEYIIRNKQEVPVRFYPVHYSKKIDLADIERHYILICPESFKYPDGQIILLGYDISETVSFKDYINKGHDPKDALRATMKDLGWS